MERLNIKRGTRELVTAGIFLAIAIVFQLMGRFNPDFSRMFVGPAVNAVILLSVYFASPRYGFLTAALTPVLAFAVGQLKAVLFPMIPFIALSNLILAFTYALFKRKPTERAISSVVGSILKSLFLYLVVTLLVPYFRFGLPQKIIESLPVAFGITQLYAALTGSAIAFILTEILNKFLRKDRPDRI